MRQTVVGAFDQYTSAQRAAELLASRGVAREHIHVQSTEESADSGYRTSAESSEGGGVMASVRNFFSDVFGPDREHEDLNHYAETIKRGGAVVAVDVDEDDRLEVAEVCSELRSAGAIDLDKQIDEWRANDRSGHALPVSADMRSDSADRGREEVIPVVQEDIDIGKRVVEQGGIRVYTHVVEQPVRESVDLRSEKAVVERRPMDRPLTDADAAFQDRSIEVRETAEKAVVSKTARVVEEVRVGKEVQDQTQDVNDTVRHTEVDVQRVDDGMAERRDGTLSGGLEHRDLGNDVHALEYREHWNQNYGQAGGRYEDYDPAYRYGHSLSSDERYRGKDWSAIEPEARRDWEARNPGGTWDRVKGSVRHAWERAKS